MWGFPPVWQGQRRGRILECQAPVLPSASSSRRRHTCGCIGPPSCPEHQKIRTAHLGLVLKDDWVRADMVRGGTSQKAISPALWAGGCRWQGGRSFGISSHTSACFRLEWSEGGGFEKPVFFISLRKLHLQIWAKKSPAKLNPRQYSGLLACCGCLTCQGPGKIENTEKSFRQGGRTKRLDSWHQRTNLLRQLCLPVQNKIS